MQKSREKDSDYRGQALQNCFLFFCKGKKETLTNDNGSKGERNRLHVP